MAPEKNKKRCFTIMVIPHSEESTFSLCIPFYGIQLAIMLLLVIIASSTFLGYSFLKVSAEASQVEDLRQINRAQEQEINALAIETEKAMNQILELDELIEEITEKIDDVDILDDVESIQTRITATRKTFQDSSRYRFSNQDNQTGSYSNAVSSAEYTILEQPYNSFDSFSQSYSNYSSSNMLFNRAFENITILHGVIPEQIDTLDEVELYIGKIETRLEEIMSKPSLWPARGRVTSGFGTRSIPYAGGYQFHTGVDIAGAHGSKVRASANGEVTFLGYRGSLGNLIIIYHGSGYETYYAHLDGFAVNKGDIVEKGQTIGYMGASGRTTGTHLHYEVHYKGSPVNPRRYMEEP